MIARIVLLLLRRPRLINAAGKAAFLKIKRVPSGARRQSVTANLFFRGGGDS
jgi:hypothetical protein